jgi:hypothetical protein
LDQEVPNVASNAPPRTSNSEVIEELQRLALCIQPLVSAERLWERVLSDGDRRRLGGDCRASYATLGTAGMWKELHGGSPEQVVLEVARKLGFVDQTTYEWLLRAVGKNAPAVPRPDRPVWNGATGELRWKSRVIRRVRAFTQASNIHVILTAFERQGWPDRIDNPLPLGQQQLHQTLRSLNRGLRGMRFHALNGGRVITWKRR